MTPSHQSLAAATVSIANNIINQNANYILQRDVRTQLTKLDTRFLSNNVIFMTGNYNIHSTKVKHQLGKGCSIGPLHTAGNLLVCKLVSPVVDGHAPVRLAGVCLGPHHEGLGEGEDGPGELVAQHLAAVSLLGVPLGHIVQVLAPGDVQVVVVTQVLAIDGQGHVVAPQSGHLEGPGVRLPVGDAAVARLGLDAGGVVQVVQVAGVQVAPTARLCSVPAGLVILNSALVVKTLDLTLNPCVELKTTL